MSHKLMVNLKTQKKKKKKRKKEKKRRDLAF